MANKTKTNYQGIFFDKQEIERLAAQYRGSIGTPIETMKKIQDPHITLQYRPTQEQIDAFKPLIGQKVQVTISQYGSDGNNEGFYVSKIQAQNPKTQEICDKVPSGIPHITTAVNGEPNPETGKPIGKPVNTYKLFDGSQPDVAKPIEPITITATMGAYQIIPNIGPKAVTAPSKPKTTPFNEPQTPENEKTPEF